MDGELAQVIVLATHGSTWLANQSVEPPELDRDNDTFRYVGSVAFDLLEPAHTHAPDVASWLAQRAGIGIERLWLVIPDKRRDQTVDTPSGKRTFREDFLAGFVGAGSWSLLATGDHRTESWRASWTAAGSRTWRVQYVGEGIDAARPPSERNPPTLPIPVAQADLLAALREVRDFASLIDFEPWPQRFNEAVAFADPVATPTPTTWFDAFPEHGFADDSKRLLAIASRAWVFGGMGWWGDRIFDDVKIGEERDRLGALLYAALLRACAAAVNTPLAAA